MPCYGCERELPAVLYQGHHPHPQAAGGANLGVVHLCPTCHTACHTAARAFQQGQEGMARDVLSVVVDHRPEAVERLLVIVRTEVRAWADPKPRARQPVSVEFSREIYARLQAISKGILTSNKRQIGVPKLVRVIVEAWLRKEAGPQPIRDREPESVINLTKKPELV